MWFFCWVLVNLLPSLAVLRELWALCTNLSSCLALIWIVFIGEKSSTSSTKFNEFELRKQFLVQAPRKTFKIFLLEPLSLA